MSQITIVGNLTAPPELRYTQSGLAVANFTIAVNRGKDNKKETDYHRCQVWREMAEHVAQLDKGTRVIATGTMKQREYQTREGEKRQAWELDVFAMGPDLRYATAVVTRTESKSASANQSDTWAEGGYGSDAPF